MKKILVLALGTLGLLAGCGNDYMEGTWSCTSSHKLGVILLELSSDGTGQIISEKKGLIKVKQDFYINDQIPPTLELFDEQDSIVAQFYVGYTGDKHPNGKRFDHPGYGGCKPVSK